MLNDSIKLAWLYPSTLYLHGERGNILAFKRIADELNIDLKVDTIELTQPFNPENYDIIYCPAGEIVHFPAVIDSLNKVKDQLLDFINSGKPLIVTGNSVGLFGNQINRHNNEVINGLNLINIITYERSDIYGDDIYFKTYYHNKIFEIIGHQIQMTNLDIMEEEPFGQLKYGYGNNGKTSSEGIKKENSIFTNTLGPLFVLNPWLTQEVIFVALENKGINKELGKTDFKLEKKCFDSKLNYIKNKKTNLKNI